MSQYSERSQELANELRDKAISNLQRQGRTVSRSASSGKFVTNSTSTKHPRTTVVSRGGRDAGTGKLK